MREPQSNDRPARLAQPCAAFDGCRCRVYADRPKYCRDFECLLFKSVKAGTTETNAALRIIGTARERAGKVRRLLRELGDSQERLPLGVRFRRAARRLQDRELDAATADLYAQLTLAVHDLNLLLSEAFYPGSTQAEPKRSRLPAAAAVACGALALFMAVAPVRADQVEMGNGDRYFGQVLSVNSNTVYLHSNVLGTVRLPRKRVAVITFGRVAGTNSPALPSATNAPASAASATSSNAVANIHPALRQLGVSTNLIRQVQRQFLSGAGDEANAKFNELLGGLMSGKLTVDDIRAQAKSAADQLRTLQKESGEEAGFAASAYLSILDHFLKETAPSPGSANNTPAPSSKPKQPKPEEE